MRGIAMMLMLAGCIPDFQLDSLTFSDSGAREDAAPQDAMEPAPDAAIDGGEGRDSGEHRDAAGPDAEPEDVGFFENCSNGTDDDMDQDADCADSDCDTFAFDDGTLRWQCRNGVRAEANCDNQLDDDGNEEFDCHDPDCGCTAGVLLCCPNGECLQLTDLCGG